MTDRTKTKGKQSKGLTDAELAAKYETGKRFNLDKAIKIMTKKDNSKK